MELSVLLNKMFVFVVLMVIGYVLARRGVLDRSFTKAASNLTLNVFMAATIVNSVLNVNTSLSWAELGKIQLVVWIMQLTGYVLAWLVARVVPCEEEHRPGFELLMSMGNSMFIALPLVDALYGPIAVFYMSMTCIPFNILLYSYGVWRLRSDPGQKGFRFRDILSVPLIAALIALAIFLLKPPVPAALKGLIGSMSGATMPLSMIVIGSSLGSVSLFDAFKNGRLYLASFVRLILIPLVTWFLCRLVTQDPVLLMTMMVTAACPSAVVVTVLSIQYGRDGVFTAEGTLKSTVLSMITLPLWVMILG